MIGMLIVADQKIAMLKPLLHDKDLVKKWDGSYGAHGLNLLRKTLFFDLIRELVAISIDKNERSPSVRNILRLFDSQDLLTHIKHEYCEPSTIIWLKDSDKDSKKFWEGNEESKRFESEQRFNETFQSVKDQFKALEESALTNKIRDSRNKLIAHFEMRHDGEEPKMLDPSDFGLKWGDVEEYFKSIEPIIINLVLMISKEEYAWDLYRAQHEKIANDFWYK